MRISDWSADVCSSDLRLALADAPELAAAAQSGEGELRIEGGRVVGAEMTLDSVAAALPGLADPVSAETMTGSWAENKPERRGMRGVHAQLTLVTVTIQQAHDRESAGTRRRGLWRVEMG